MNQLGRWRYRFTSFLNSQVKCLAKRDFTGIYLAQLLVTFLTVFSTLMLPARQVLKFKKWNGGNLLLKMLKKHCLLRIWEGTNFSKNTCRNHGTMEAQGTKMTYHW